MKKVSFQIKCDIVSAYLDGEKYNKIQKDFGVNRWNIQDALSKFNIKTDRIKSTPRLPGNKKVVPGRLMDRYHDGDFLPPMKVNKDNPVLESDLDIMERIDNADDTGDFLGGSYKIVIDENDKFKYKGI